MILINDNAIECLLKVENIPVEKKQRRVKKINTATIIKQSRSVRFAPSVEYKETISLDEMTKEEIKKCWFSEREMTNIQRRSLRLIVTIEKHLIDVVDEELCKRLIANAEKKLFAMDESFCLLGLESQIGILGQRKQTNIRTVQERVFRKQQKQ